MSYYKNPEVLRVANDFMLKVKKAVHFQDLKYLPTPEECLVVEREVFPFISERQEYPPGMTFRKRPR